MLCRFGCVSFLRLYKAAVCRKAWEKRQYLPCCLWFSILVRTYHKNAKQMGRRSERRAASTVIVVRQRWKQAWCMQCMCVCGRSTQHLLTEFVFTVLFDFFLSILSDFFEFMLKYAPHFLVSILWMWMWIFSATSPAKAPPAIVIMAKATAAVTMWQMAFRFRRMRRPNI